MRARAILTKSLTLRGFINTEFVPEHYGDFKLVSARLKEYGRIRHREDITEGFDKCAGGFHGCCRARIRQSPVRVSG